MNEDLPYVSVIIPTYRDAERLSKCLSALSSQSYPRELFEVVVVNNESGVNLKAILDRDDLNINLLLIDESHVGSYAARNAGISASKGAVLAFTDSDCIPSPTWIREGVNIFVKRPHISRVGGFIAVFQDDCASKIAWLHDDIFLFNQEVFINKKGYSVTANLFCRKVVFSRVGLFDSKLLSGGDTEWGVRAKKLGEEIAYSSNAVVYHPCRKNIKEIRKKHIRVSGGIYARSVPENASHIKRAIFTLSAFKPPIGAYIKIYNCNKAASLEKVGLAVLVTYLRFIRAFVYIKLATNLTSPQRS